jgi:hypothetical protein
MGLQDDAATRWLFHLPQDASWGQTQWMRKQYFFRPSDRGFDAWDVDRLIELSKDLPVHDVPLGAITEFDTPHWFGSDGAPMTVRILVEHVQLINVADLSYPVILGSEGQLMDGMHRVARAALEGRATVRAVRFAEPLEPDYRDVRPEDLPY